MVPAVFKALLLVALLVTAGGSAQADSTALHITSTGKNTEAQPTYRLDWTAISNSTYLVQSATSLAPGVPWTTLDAVTPVDQVGSYQLQLTATDSTGLSSPPATFYRLILPQPQITSVEPAIVVPGVPVDFYVLGQNFPINALLQVNGVTQSGTIYSNSSVLVQPSFTPDVAGNYQVSLVISGVVVSTFNVVAADPLANPELVLQGPPDEPPASPAMRCAQKGKEKWRSSLNENYSFDVEQTLNIGSQSSGAGAGKVTFNPFSITRKSSGIRENDNVVFDVAEGKKGLNAVNVKLARMAGGGDGDTDEDYGDSADLNGARGYKRKDGALVSADFNYRYRPGNNKTTRIKITREWSNDTTFRGASVSPFSGEVQESDVDLAIPGRGLDFVWARTYRSRTHHTATLLGNCWTLSYDVSVAQGASGITVNDGTGRQDTFTLQTNGIYTCPEFFREGTVSNNTFTLTFADTGRWVFNPFDGTAAAGKLFQIITRKGDTMTLGYDTSGRLTQVVDDLGRTNSMSYNTGGQLASVTDFSGRSVTYQYYQGQKGDNGSAGDLKSVTSPPVTGTPNGNDFPSGKTTTYSYSKSFPLDRENHLLLTVTDPKGQTAAVFSYEHSAADPNYLRCTAAQEGTNTACRYNWILASRPSGSYAVVKCIANDPVGNVSENFFDARGHCVIERDYTGRATPGLPVTDTLNRPTGQLRSTDPAYYETAWSWNNDSLCTAVREPANLEIPNVRFVYQSDFDPATPARKRADCRVVRQIASSAVDLNGDGVADVSDRSWHFDYDPRFGSDPTPLGMAIKTKGTGADHNRIRPRGWDGTIKGLAVPDGNGVAIKTKGTGADNNRIRPKGWDGTIKGLVIPDGNGMAIKTKGTGAEANRSMSSQPKIIDNQKGLLVSFCVSATDPRGNVTTGTYDTNGNRVKVQFHWDRQSSVERDFAYDTYGQLTTITNEPDANGHSRVDKFAYLQGQLTQCIADASGLAITSAFEYDARGNLTRAVDPRGNDCLFTYNALDQCVRAQSPPNVSSRCTTDFSYDANDNLVQTSRDVRDAADNLVGTQVNRASYNGQDCLSEMALAMDATRAQTNRFVYDGNNQCVQVLGPDAVSGADPHQMAAYEYDERGLLFREIGVPGSGNSPTNTYDYNPNGQTVHVNKIEALVVKQKTCAYDGFSRLNSLTDEMGNQTVCFYDANDNPKVVRLYGELSDVPGSAGNVRLSESSYEYDGLNRCFRAHDLSFNPATQSPIGSGDAVSTCVLAPNDECVSVTDSLGRATSFAYDTACRLASATDARGNITVTVLDAMDNPTAITRTELPDGGGSPQVFTTSYAFDSLNRCVSASDNVGNTSTCAYDSLDRVVRETNPNGNDTTYAYDLLGDCLSSTDYAGSSLSSGTPPTIVRSSSATYDTSLRCLTSTDPNGNTTSYAYDSLGNCTTVTEADGTHQQLVWSPRSNLIQATDANGTTVTNGYDLCERLIHRDIAARGVAVATTTFETFAYDGSSRLVLAGNDVSQVTFSYDSFGDCTASSQDGLAQSVTYDSAGNPLSLTYPSGRVVTYAYDVLDQVTNISTSANGVSHPQLARFAYAGPGRLARIGRDNGLKTQIDWNGLANPANSTGDYGWQEVSSVRDGTVASPALVCDVTGSYSRTQSKLTRADAGRSSLTLSYDALEQLVEASDSVVARDIIYALDAAGNRSHVITNGVLMTPDYAMSSALPPGDFFMNRYTTTPFGSQQYDANGNLIVRASAASPTFYHYDYADRLVEVDAVGTLGTLGPVATFTYDALGNRISKTTYPGVPAAPVTVQYVHKGATEHCDDGNNVIEERVGTSVSRAYCDMTAFTGTGAAQYYHCDGLGNVLALTDAGGNVLERYAYDDYGLPQFLDANGSPLVGSDGQPVTSSPLGNPFLFQGLEWDGETGLLGDGGGNYFDPPTGRAVRGKVKNIKDMGTGGRAFDGNNPWSGGGGGGGGTAMKSGTVKFFNNAKGFGMVIGDGSKTHTKTGHVTLMK